MYNILYIMLFLHIISTRTPYLCKLYRYSNFYRLNIIYIHNNDGYVKFCLAMTCPLELLSLHCFVSRQIFHSRTQLDFVYVRHTLTLQLVDELLLARSSRETKIVFDFDDALRSIIKRHETADIRRVFRPV